MSKRLASIVLLIAALLIKSTDIMGKKDLGSLLALYPKPKTVGGALVDGKVNWWSTALRSNTIKFG